MENQTEKEGILADGWMSREELGHLYGDHIIRLKIIDLIASAPSEMSDKDIDLVQMYFDNWIQSRSK